MESLRGCLIKIGIGVIGLLLGGCQAAAPIHVWAPPTIQSTVGKRVAIPPLAGDPEIAGPLHAAMLRLQPRSNGIQVYAVDARTLERDETIRLASATEGQTSDIALLSLARSNGVDYILQGEVMSIRDAAVRRSTERPDPMLPSRPKNLDPLARIPGQDVDSEDSLLRVSWNLIEVTGSQPLSGQPVVTRRLLGQDEAAVVTAAAEAAWQLVIPHVIQDQAQLAAPRLALGSAAIRRGNEAAAHGDWMQAEQRWMEVLRQRPRQHAALHNLAVAAVARQDYEAARRLIAQALQISSSPLYQDTAVWIEQRQRDYHIAFGLPDPPGGWAATRR